MSDFSSNPALQAIQRLNTKYEEIGDNMKNFMERQASGEEPDPEEFAQLLEAQSTTKSALAAQVSLLQKPIKTVLNESKG
jgi:hypothetical protein